MHLEMDVAEVAAGIGDLDVISAGLVPIYAFASNVVGSFWEVLEITVVCHLCFCCSIPRYENLRLNRRFSHKRSFARYRKVRLRSSLLTKQHKGICSDGLL